MEPASNPMLAGSGTETSERFGFTCSPNRAAKPFKVAISLALNAPSLCPKFDSTTWKS